MQKKKENTKKSTPTKRTRKGAFTVVCLPEYQKDLSHMMTPENRRPEQEEKYRKLAGDKLVDR